MRKRTETSGVVRPIGEWLQLQENAGKILWWDRLNSGQIVFKRGGVWQKVRLCREGTPDMYCILPSGAIIWIECKVEGKDIEKGSPQEAFRTMLFGAQGHHHIVARSLEEFVMKFSVIYGY